MREDASQVVDRLDEAVRQLTFVMMDIEPEDLATRPDDDEWSPIEILAHLKASDDITTPRVAIILTHPSPAFQSIDERTWAEIAGYVNAPADQTLMAYQRRRAELVWQLRRLPDDAWDRAANHEGRGRITLLDLLRSLAKHEEEHLAQLEAMLKDDEEG